MSGEIISKLSAELHDHKIKRIGHFSHYSHHTVCVEASGFSGLYKVPWKYDIQMHLFTLAAF